MIKKQTLLIVIDDIDTFRTLILQYNSNKLAEYSVFGQNKYLVHPKSKLVLRHQNTSTAFDSRYKTETSVSYLFSTERMLFFHIKLDDEKRFKNKYKSL